MAKDIIIVEGRPIESVMQEMADRSVLNKYVVSPAEAEIIEREMGEDFIKKNCIINKKI